MSDLFLKELDIINFRSIRGHVHVPLDAKVVLVHGENGVGKTSLLSAIELGLTGGVQSLWRADPKYARQLLHRSTTRGNVTVKTDGPDGDRQYEALLDQAGARSVNALEHHFGAFFRERAYLPQSLLGQLLQIYQESGSGADSPLAKFVGDLLGLDRLDAIEVGLKPLADVRNVRKVVEGWSESEIEKTRLDKLLEDQCGSRTEVLTAIEAAISELSEVCKRLEASVDVNEETLDALTAELSSNEDEQGFDRLMDQHRRLASIRRELASSDTAVTQNSAQSPNGAAEAILAYASWESEHGALIAALRSRVEKLLPLVSLPTDHAQFGEQARTSLQSERKRLIEKAKQAHLDVERLTKARGELAVSQRQRTTIDEEILLLPKTAGSLGVVLSEISSYVVGDICPLCDRDFVELERGSLANHVQNKIGHLSASAERLVALGRSRSQQQITIERLEGEIEALEARVIDAKSLAAIERQAVDFDQASMELDKLTATLAEGSLLRAREVAARRAVSEKHSHDVALAAARETLSEFALALGTAAISDEESFESAASRLENLLSRKTTQLKERIALRRRGTELVTAVSHYLARRTKIETTISHYNELWHFADDALKRGQVLREDGNSIRRAVNAVRSSIIRREFNDRLNRVWRDLFVRLAPNEPFVPAFRIPESNMQRLQPKLITEYRDNGEMGGTPGAMLSTGNLNTAALTLFIALHLSVPKTLPWLIFDDPVQSMDDVHVTHFASLLRTLSKEHGRQVVIAVHDRQLFEYLRLELSPAFVDDSLLTLELARRHPRDTLCVAKRLSFKEETALRIVA